MTVATRKGPFILKGYLITTDLINKVTSKSRKLSDEEGIRISDSEVVRRALDFYFNTKEEGNG